MITVVFRAFKVFVHMQEYVKQTISSFEIQEPVDPLCIPLRGNAVRILFLSSERIGIFKSNFVTLIQISIEIF